MLKSISKSVFLVVSLLMVASPGLVIGRRVRPELEPTPPWDDGPAIPPPEPGTYSKSQIHKKKNFRSSV
jgi:hypothetical protein